MSTSNLRTAMIRPSVLALGSALVLLSAGCSSEAGPSPDESSSAMPQGGSQVAQTQPASHTETSTGPAAANTVSSDGQTIAAETPSESAGQNPKAKPAEVQPKSKAGSGKKKAGRTPPTAAPTAARQMATISLGVLLGSLC